MTAPIRHVEMYDSQLFCEADGFANIDQRAWHDDASALGGATCLRCLAAIQVLGEQAAAVRAELIVRGATDEQQLASLQDEQLARDSRRTAVMDTTLTTVSLGEILKKQYDTMGKP